MKRRPRTPRPPSNERPVLLSAFGARPRRDGRHPWFAHLCWFDIEPRYGWYILTTAAGTGSIVMSEDDLGYALEIKGGEIPDGAWLSDAYLDLLEEE